MIQAQFDVIMFSNISYLLSRKLLQIEYNIYCIENNKQDIYAAIKIMNQVK